METNAHYSIVGFFMVVLISAIAITITWLSSDITFEHYNKYLIFMNESVSGISKDSMVEFNGVEVGTVEDISISKQNPSLVKLTLSVKQETPITTNTVATLNSRGLTGITYVSLKDSSSTHTPLRREPGEPYPVIKTAPSLYVRIDSAIKELTENVKTVTASMQSMFDKHNREAFQNILDNMNTVSNTLAINSRKMSRIIANTEEASNKFPSLLESSDAFFKSSQSAMRTISTQTLPQAYEAMANLNDMSRTLASLSAELKRNPSMLVRGKAPAPLGPGES